MSKTDLDGEWLEALEPEEEEVEQETGSDDDGGDDNDSAPEESGAEPDKEDDEGDADKGDPDNDDKPDSEKEPDDGAVEQEPVAEEPSTKDAIRDAMREIDSEKNARFERTDSFKKEVAETLYPQGIDRTLRDSEGDPITSIDDLTKLMNPKTDDYFTDEEAGAWLLNAQQQLNKEVETVERFIEGVAEVNIQLEEGAQRVADKYGDILSQDDALRTRLLQAYDKTITKDPKTGVAIKISMEVEEFFDIALERLVSEKAQEQESNADDTKKTQKALQSERGDLKPSGKAEQLDPADKEWAEAYKEYEEGAV